MFVVLLILVSSAILSVVWVNGIDYMKKNHPDYTGDDFLNTSSGRDGWDDNHIHSEGDF